MISTYFLPDTVGGVELHIFHLSKALRRRGHDVTIFHSVVSNSSEKGHVDRNDVDGVPVVRVASPSAVAEFLRKASHVGADNKLGYLIGFVRKASRILSTRRVYNVLRKELGDVTVFHQHDFSSSWLLTRLVARTTPTVLTNHTGEFLFIRRHGLLSKTLHWLLKHYNAIIGPSQELCDLGHGGWRAAYIPNGVDVAFFAPPVGPDREQVRSRLGVKPDEVLVICPRRWAPTKGVKYLVEAVPKVKARLNQRVRYLMVGSDYQEYPAYRSEILERIEQLRVTDDMLLVGNANTSQMREYLWASDIAVLPSLMEATSLSALEAMATGLPVVATSVGGLPELIHPSENGLLVPPADPDGLAEGLVRLIQDPAGRERMGSRGRQMVVAEYSWDSVAQQTEAVYQKALLEFSSRKTRVGQAHL